MNITLFNKKYLVRRFGEPREVRGYMTNPYQDFLVSMHVHPLGTDAVQALPEGERNIRRLEAHSSEKLMASDQDAGIKGDLLYYHGDWYECISAVDWDHTLLSHLNYQFVIVPKDAAGTIDTEKPEDYYEDDGDYKEEW